MTLWLRRREFIAALGGAAALNGALLGTQAQQRPIAVVGMLWPNSRDVASASLAAFLDGLKGRRFY